jgi:molecular chaperone HscC
LNVIIGIDLGTTNSAAAYWKDGAAHLVPNRLGQFLTPSAVSLDEQGKVLVGLAARERQTSHPTATATAFKRFMGTSRILTLAGTNFTPEELSALVLRSLKEDAEVALGSDVTEAVITVPAYFNDKQRKATKRAGELAGFKVERLINEPTAAALAYGIHQLGADAQFLVFDLGGGTFDVSILEIFEGIIEVRASTGDNRLGGEDFNEVIIAMMRAQFANDWGKAGKDGDALFQLIRQQAERARRSLSTSDSATMALSWRDKPYEYNVTAEAVEEKCANLLNRLRDPVLNAMRDSKIKPDQLAEIILVGGATRMPMVRRAVTRMFGRFPNSSVNPDEAIAVGAAIQAGLKARDAALKEVVLTDVCPFSLGVAISAIRPDGSREDGVFSPIIERNTVIPASRVHGYCTMEKNQRSVNLFIYQGESRKVSDNVALGMLEVPMPKGEAGQTFECRFSYDIDGLLEVDVTVDATGEKRQLVISDSDEDVSSEAVANRRDALARLKVHPRDSELNRALLARAERLWENALGEQRDFIGNVILQFQAVLERQDPRAVEAAQKQLAETLDQIEGESFL